MKLRNIAVTPGNRAFLAGQTGSGKTTLARELLGLATFPVVVYDAKGLIQWPGYERTEKLATLKTLSYPRCVYVPPVDIQDAPEKQDEFFWILYQRGNCTVYIDEVYSVCNGNVMPPYYKAILTRGRERGITCLSSTQRPKSIPQVLMSESEHFYIFRLQLDQDRERVNTLTGLASRRIQRLKKHQFYYLEPSEDSAIWPLMLGLTETVTAEKERQ